MRREILNVCGRASLSAQVGYDLSQALDQQMVSVTKAGVDGKIGGKFVPKAPANGYTLLLAEPQA